MSDHQDQCMYLWSGEREHCHCFDDAPFTGNVLPDFPVDEQTLDMLASAERRGRDATPGGDSEQ